MSDGFDSDIAQGGTNLSGGQKQRLSIARALVRKPEIYIFDDSFSALDFKTDAQAARGAETRNDRSPRCFIVAQRVSTVMDADQIIVLDEGRIVGIGTHRELMANQSHLSRDRALAAVRGGDSHERSSARPAAQRSRAVRWRPVASWAAAA